MTTTTTILLSSTSTSTTMEGPARSSYRDPPGSSAGKSAVGKEPWRYRYGCGYLDAGDSLAFLGELSWPPRLYSCAFCHREFRSAQALGGHMNVHRRDRAKLRASPPAADTLSSDHSFEGIPNLNYPPEPLPLPLLRPLTPPLPSSGCRSLGGRFGGLEGAGGGPALGKPAAAVVRLELEIGICSGGGCDRVEEELDLELRLGYG